MKNFQRSLNKVRNSRLRPIRICSNPDVVPLNRNSIDLPYMRNMEAQFRKKLASIENSRKFNKASARIISEYLKSKQSEGIGAEDIEVKRFSFVSSHCLGVSLFLHFSLPSSYSSGYLFGVLLYLGVYSCLLPLCLFPLQTYCTHNQLHMVYFLLQKYLLNNNQVYVKYRFLLYTIPK